MSVCVVCNCASRVVCLRIACCLAHVICWALFDVVCLFVVCSCFVVVCCAWLFVGFCVVR